MDDKTQLLANLQEQRQAPIAIDSGAQPSSDPCGVSSPDDSVLIFKFRQIAICAMPAIASKLTKRI